MSAKNNTNTSGGIDDVIAISAHEIDQIDNIGDNVISSTIWGYINNFNQGLSTTSNVTFNTAVLSASSNQITCGSGSDITIISTTGTGVSNKLQLNMNNATRTITMSADLTLASTATVTFNKAFTLNTGALTVTCNSSGNTLTFGASGTIAVPSFTTSDTIALLGVSNTYTAANIFGDSLFSIKSSSANTLTIANTNTSSNRTLSVDCSVNSTLAIASNLIIAASSAVSISSAFTIATSAVVTFNRGFTLNTGSLAISCHASGNTITFSSSGAIAVPSFTTSDTVALLGISNTYTAANTFGDSLFNIKSSSSNTLTIANTNSSTNRTLSVNCSVNSTLAIASDLTIASSSIVTFNKAFTLNTGALTITCNSSSNILLFGAAGIITIPSFTTSDTVALLGVANTYTAANTFGDSLFSIKSSSANTLTIANTNVGTNTTLSVNCSVSSTIAIASNLTIVSSAAVAFNKAFTLNTGALTVTCNSSGNTLTFGASGTIIIPTFATSDTVALLGVSNRFENSMVIASATGAFFIENVSNTNALRISNTYTSGNTILSISCSISSTITISSNFTLSTGPLTVTCNSSGNTLAFASAGTLNIPSFTTSATVALLGVVNAFTGNNTSSGTLNISNATAASGISTAALVVSGGIATNNGLWLPAISPGTTTLFANYEVLLDQVSGDWTGFSVARTMTFNLVRIGRIVTFGWESMIYTVTGGGSTLVSPAGMVPARFRPGLTQVWTIPGRNNAAQVSVNFELSPSGTVTLSVDGVAFAASANGGVSISTQSFISAS